jgi:hypothetical protein
VVVRLDRRPRRGSSGAKVTYQIVGDDEADLKHGLISISSPIARALIGKEAGDVPTVQAPAQVKSYEISESALRLSVAGRSERSPAVRSTEVPLMTQRGGRRAGRL